MLRDIALDDLRFQELVSEARTRIARHSPEWTEHNVSDPGITLIELFAWITDVLLYRINRIPERLHLALLELIGVTPAAATRGADERALHPRATRARPHHPGRYRSRRPAHRRAGRGRVPDQRVGHLPATVSSRFETSRRRPGQALLLGFDRPLSGLVIRLELDGSTAEDLAGEASWFGRRPPRRAPGGRRLSSTTRPTDCGWGAARSHWPCPTRRRPPPSPSTTCTGCVAGRRTRRSIGLRRADVVGATVEAVHAAAIVAESLGVSEGIPGVVLSAPAPARAGARAR